VGHQVQMHGILSERYTDSISVGFTHLMVLRAGFVAIFHGDLSKNGCHARKGAQRCCVVFAAQSWCDGAIGPYPGPTAPCNYRSPGCVCTGDGARAEKIGTRSSTALEVWSGQANASSSDVP
jgi:hypothetical protein